MEPLRAVRKNGVILMKRKSLPVLCLLVLCVLSLSLTSCSQFLITETETPKYVTREDLNTALKNYANLGAATVIGGDTYQVNVTTSGNDSIIAASKALLSTVSVFCTFEKTVYFWGTGGRMSTQQYSSAGAGVIFRLDKARGEAYILTNYHVVYDSASNAKNHISNAISIYLYGQEAKGYEIPATYIGGSMNYDLAVLKVENSAILTASNAAAVTFADSNEVSVLQTAIAVGNPEARGLSITVGHVNVDSEYITLTASDNASTVSLRVMRIDAAVNSGNSGGGLFDAKGNLIGIVNAKMSSDSVDNIGYAIPSNIARYIAENILYYCDGTEKESVYRCLIGITVSAIEYSTLYDTESGKVHRIETVAVDGITAGSISDGKLQKGDVIRSMTIDGEEYEVMRVYNVVDSMLNARIGSSVIVHVERGEQEIDVALEITEAALTAA